MNFIKILGITCLAMFAITGVSAQNTKRNQHNNIHKDLIAKQTNVKDQIKLIDDDTFIDFGFENIYQNRTYTQKDGTAKALTHSVALTFHKQQLLMYQISPCLIMAK